MENITLTPLSDTAKPLLLTLNIDAKAFEYFNGLRKQYFPPERNFLEAHLMLFHQLPANEPQVIADIEALVQQQAGFTLRVDSVNCIGKGVAFKITSDLLQLLHRRLQGKWEQWLIPQDSNKLWPHITVQNKVAPAVARELQTRLAAGFEPFEIRATGLTLWEYQGGPWALVTKFDFAP